MSNEDLIASLQSQVDFLRSRVEELEDEKAKLSSQVSNCSCHQREKKLDGSLLDCAHSVEENIKMKAGSDNRRTEKVIEKLPVSKAGIINCYSKRYVALKVMYFGQRFYGFASEAQMEPTVESEIFKALEKAWLLAGDRKEIQYSRCGRTDKGVSSVGQVIALFLRSNLREASTDNKNLGKIVLEEQNSQPERQVDYVRVLNQILPKDIRVIGWCDVPIDFHARFSCLSREYKYFFWSKNLNLLDMESAGRKFVGEHDFRNFCKMDAANVHNYRRRITSFEIQPCDMSFAGFDDNQLCSIKIRGTAFLWHQVRCMVALLFMIGRGRESPEVIDTLLDTDKTPRKPQYSMAPESPLVLHSCEFDDLVFNCSPDAAHALHAHLENECQSLLVQAAIFHEALLTFPTLVNDQNNINFRTNKKAASHVPLMLRPTEPSYEERRAKLNSRK